MVVFVSVADVVVVVGVAVVVSVLVVGIARYLDIAARAGLRAWRWLRKTLRDR